MSKKSKVTKADISRVMATLGKRKSAAKTAAARLNARLGGRPRKRELLTAIEYGKGAA